MELLILLGCAFVVVALDVKLWRTLTPNAIAILPTTLVVLVADAVTPRMGFFRPSQEIYLAIALLFACGGLGSFLAATALRNEPESRPFSIALDGGRDTRTLTAMLGLACALLTFYMYLAFKRVGNMYEEEFSDALAGGVAGHLGLFIMLATPVLVLCRAKGDRLAACIVVAAFVLLVLRQVKSWVIVPIIFSTLLLFYAGKFGNARATLLKAALIALGLVGVFFLVYLIWVVAYNEFDVGVDQLIDSLEWIAVHFLGYLVSGVVAFSELVARGPLLDYNDPLYLVGTFRNVVAVAQGDSTTSAVGSTFLQISADHDVGSNVFSMWGTLMHRSGAWAFPLYALMIFALTLLLQIGRRHRYALYLYCFLASFLAIAWFEYYYYHANVYFAPIWLAVISLLVRRRRVDRETAPALAIPTHA
jgi:hypothetical protein